MTDHGALRVPRTPPRSRFVRPQTMHAIPSEIASLICLGTALLQLRKTQVYRSMVGAVLIALDNSCSHAAGSWLILDRWCFLNLTIIVAVQRGPGSTHSTVQARVYLWAQRRAALAMPSSTSPAKVPRGLLLRILLEIVKVVGQVFKFEELKGTGPHAKGTHRICRKSRFTIGEPPAACVSEIGSQIVRSRQDVLSKRNESASTPASSLDAFR